MNKKSRGTENRRKKLVKIEQNNNNSNNKKQVLKPDEFPYLFPFHLASESASLKVYY